MLQRYRRVLSDYSFQIRIGTGCHVAIAARRVRTAIFANQYTVHVALECFGRVGGACLWRRIQEQGGKVVQQDFECQAEMMHPGACLDSYCQEKKQSKNVSLLAEQQSSVQRRRYDFFSNSLRSSSSQDEPEPQPGVQPMKSAGSVGHPDTCKAMCCHTRACLTPGSLEPPGVHLLFLQCCGLPQRSRLHLLPRVSSKDSFFSTFCHVCLHGFGQEEQQEE